VAGHVDDVDLDVAPRPVVAAGRDRDPALLLCSIQSITAVLGTSPIL
jgi:hypothetical protein